MRRPGNPGVPVGGVAGCVGCVLTVVSLPTWAAAAVPHTLSETAIAQTSNAARSTVTAEAERVFRAPLTLRRAVYFTL